MLKVIGQWKKKQRIWRRGESLCGAHLAAINVIPNHIFYINPFKNKNQGHVIDPSSPQIKIQPSDCPCFRYSQPSLFGFWFFIIYYIYYLPSNQILVQEQDSGVWKLWKLKLELDKVVLESEVPNPQLNQTNKHSN